jgi:hypothetical protein
MKTLTTLCKICQKPTKIVTENHALCPHSNPIYYTSHYIVDINPNFTVEKFSFDKIAVDNYIYEDESRNYSNYFLIKDTAGIDHSYDENYEQIFFKTTLSFKNEEDLLAKIQAYIAFL